MKKKLKYFLRFIIFILVAISVSSIVYTFPIDNKKNGYDITSAKFNIKFYEDKVYITETWNVEFFDEEKSRFYKRKLEDDLFGFGYNDIIFESFKINGVECEEYFYDSDAREHDYAYNVTKFYNSSIGVEYSLYLKSKNVENVYEIKYYLTDVIKSDSNGNLYFIHDFFDSGYRPKVENVQIVVDNSNIEILECNKKVDRDNKSFLSCSENNVSGKSTFYMKFKGEDVTSSDIMTSSDYLKYYLNPILSLIVFILNMLAFFFKTDRVGVMAGGVFFFTIAIFLIFDKRKGHGGNSCHSCSSCGSCGGCSSCGGCGGVD